MDVKIGDWVATDINPTFYGRVTLIFEENKIVCSWFKACGIPEITAYQTRDAVRRITKEEENIILQHLAKKL